MSDLTWAPIQPCYLPKVVIDRFPRGPREAFVASVNGFGAPTVLGGIFYILRCDASPWWFCCNARGEIEIDPTGGHRKRFRTAENAKSYAALHYRPARAL